MKALLHQWNAQTRTFQLAWADAPEPCVGAAEHLIEVHATAMNRADWLQLQGHYPAPEGASPILGLECAGIDLTTGKRVCALLAGGGYAERVSVDAGLLLPIPDSMSFEAAAAVPEAWLTAYLNLFGEARLLAGEKVLIHAAASGVGTAAIQLAKQAGAYVMATSRTASKLALCLQLGADEAIHMATPLTTLTPHSIDVILDVLGGGDAFAQHCDWLRTDGRLVIIALMQGGAAQLNLKELVSKRLRIIGSTLRSRSLADKIALTARFQQEVWPLFQSGIYQSVIDRILNIEEAHSGFDAMRNNQNSGKIVLKIK